jgi:hypothetical protein
MDLEINRVSLTPTGSYPPAGGREFDPPLRNKKQPRKWRGFVLLQITKTLTEIVEF